MARGERENKSDNPVMLRNLALSVLMVASIGVTVAGFLTAAGAAATIMQIGGIVGIIASLMCATVNNYDYLYKNGSRSQGEKSRQEFMEVSALGTEKEASTWAERMGRDSQTAKDGHHAAIIKESRSNQSQEARTIH